MTTNEAKLLKKGIKMTENEIIVENKKLKKEVEDKERAYNDEFCLRKEW